MKKISLVVLSTLVAVVLSTGCKHEVTVNKTVEIDSLQTVLSGYEKLFAEISVNEVETITSTIDADMDSAFTIAESKKVTITEEQGTFFGRYQAMKSGLKKFGTRYNDIKEELAHCKTQLSSLKSDINGGKLDNEAQSKYIMDEAAAIKNVGTAIEQIHGASVTVIGQFKDRRPEFLETLASLGKKK